MDQENSEIALRKTEKKIFLQATKQDKLILSLELPDSFPILYSKSLHI